DGHYCGAPLRPCAKEIIDFFKFPKLLFTALPSPSRRPYLYQQDGAPAHTSNLAQNWRLENLDV
ncbi:Transposable element tcb2 transposase, partial [Caligus rogercresseyi]